MEDSSINPIDKHLKYYLGADGHYCYCRTSTNVMYPEETVNKILYQLQPVGGDRHRYLMLVISMKITATVTYRG